MLGPASVHLPIIVSLYFTMKLPLVALNLQGQITPVILTFLF